MKKGYLLVFLTAIISGFSIFINRFGVSIINPYIFTFLKNASVAVFLLSILLLFKDWKVLKKIKKKQWVLLILIGLIGGSIPFLLFFKGLSITTAANGAFLHKTMFIYVALLAFV
ncbi:EamA family transporter, partial [Patescibacteria group bacterium]|nr:EamA family transporter [Patescibacteria group bacterium]